MWKVKYDLSGAELGNDLFQKYKNVLGFLASSVKATLGYALNIQLSLHLDQFNHTNHLHHSVNHS